MLADRAYHGVHVCDFENLHQGVAFDISTLLGHVVSFIASGWEIGAILCANNI